MADASVGGTTLPLPLLKHALSMQYVGKLCPHRKILQHLSTLISVSKGMWPAVRCSEQRGLEAPQYLASTS